MPTIRNSLRRLIINNFFFQLKTADHSRTCLIANAQLGACGKCRYVKREACKAIDSNAADDYETMTSLKLITSRFGCTHRRRLDS